MNMKVRACVLAVVLVVLGTSSVFGQIVYSPGIPGAPSSFNYAVNREGNRELLAPVTVCANTAGNAAGATTFDVNDQFQILFGSSLVAPGGAFGTPPILSTTGALSASQLAVFASAAAPALTFSATADVFQPPALATSVPPFAVPPPQSRVTVTVTGPLPAGVFACFTVQNLRFDIANTGTSAGAAPGAVITGTTFGAAVFQAQEALVVLSPQTAAGIGVSANAAIATGAPVITVAQLGGGTGNAASGLGAAFTTFAFGGAAGYANGTGCTTGSLAIPTGFGNPSTCANTTVTAGASQIPRVVQNSGLTASGTLSVQENVTPATTGPGALAVNLGVGLGGGLFRNFASSGPATTTILNAAGQTTGTQFEVAVSNMPVGSTITFGSTATSASPGATLTLTLVAPVGGVIAAPGGTATYVVSNNEGPGILAAPLTVGPSVEIPFTVSEASTLGATGTARYVVRVRPLTGTTGSPTYSEINLSSVMPSQAVLILPNALFNVASNQTTRTYPYVLYTGGTTTSDYDSGIVLANSGKTAAVSATAVSTTSTTGAQDGTFTVFFIDNATSNTAPKSVRSDAAGFPDASKILSAGKLKVGDTWQALASEVAKAAGITGAWKGYVVIVADFPQSNGFAFISQFTNPGGGATMGYISQ